MQQNQSSRNDAGTTGYLHVKKKKKINLHTDLTPLTKINSKWITDLNEKQKTMRLLEDNTGENLDDLVHGNELLGTTPKA